MQTHTVYSRGGRWPTFLVTRSWSAAWKVAGFATEGKHGERKARQGRRVDPVKVPDDALVEVIKEKPKYGSREARMANGRLRFEDESPRRKMVREKIADGSATPRKTGGWSR